MTTFSRLKIIIVLFVVFALGVVSYAQAEDYKWLKSPNYKTIFVYADFNGCESIEDKLNETVKRTFSRSNIKATISKSMTFNVTDTSKDAVYELVDEELVSDGKIILHLYGKCIRYSPGSIYQFDVRFGVNNSKYSQAVLFSTPHHSVVGVDSIMGIERAFRTIMRNAVDEYLSANQG